MGEASMRKWMRRARERHAHEDLSPRAGLTPEEIDLWVEARRSVLHGAALRLRQWHRHRRRCERFTAWMWRHLFPALSGQRGPCAISIRSQSFGVRPLRA